ncbi:metallopeptidase family protein [Phycisphaera mikurensis]|uniref:Metallopeptidase family protein n=1 Tax=Phycisphaera mikurensis (strain NBRC 102666 / KCTC 22515 / FYK2301M01) TaxID=1142394 RepID=I0IFX9_PHYMF|nr:metallopeptidase family protein [Phycisphaera mikurensis]MBB6440446.1 putative Zn-dependent protease with MMP-like domain [Phycisphaera mikurensis]BAM04167.1 hypothetical protein PSMK_20080 [Phycisphaera mikurensis NBRC 102666]
MPATVHPRERDVFDGLLEEEIEALPAPWTAWLEEVAVIVEDRVPPAIAEDMGLTADEAEGLLGLHTGVPLTERSVEDPASLPPEVRLFRAGLLAHAGWSRRRDSPATRARLAEQIRVTLLHELGHHAGLDEDDLDEAGYG